MDANVFSQANDWRHTKDAVANFKRLLLCAKCSTVMKEPVCLGTCEHLLCRSCAGPRAGDGCVVCHSPAWVKDIQINRQLSSIIQLFSGLDSLLNPTENTEPAPNEMQTQAENSMLKHKKNVKIWFSPRSRKVRCRVDKPSDVTIADSKSSADMAEAQPGSVSVQRRDLAVFNFISSSQDSDSTSSQRRTHDNRNKKKMKKPSCRKRLVQKASKVTQKQAKKMRLQAINQEWGIIEEADGLKEEEQACTGGVRRSSKRVSFQSPAVTSEDSQPEVPQGNSNSFNCGGWMMKQGQSEGGNRVLRNQAQPCQSEAERFIQHHALSDNSPNGYSPKGVSQHSSKRLRVDEQVVSLETTPKRPRSSPSRRKQTRWFGQMVAALSNPATMISPVRGNNTTIHRKRQADSSCVPVTVERVSPRSPGTPVGRSNSGSPAVTKRNHKGETLLHLAAIKGDIDAVKELLEQGADPNLKDNAGWTPLHEACNLGHLAVVEVLISRGALLNTPGYENDSPLHDAVRNGHLAIAKLLLQHGASKTVLNLYGKQPADYAIGRDMQEIFWLTSEESQCADTFRSPSADLSVVCDFARRDEKMVLLANNLSQSEQQQLTALEQVVGGRRADTFSGSVSHVVVPEGSMQTDHFTLLAVLAGCWVLNTAGWKRVCRQAGGCPKLSTRQETAPIAVESTDGTCSHLSSMAVSSSYGAPLRRRPKTSWSSCSAKEVVNF
ncbi:BRCA1-associated RING domain protein 1 isoform X1 [Thalassophryne amazonica]|uniref:BRCA1-associated RING domain protein 1 isoform X1 n=1 Tax=Thalassophryne amazonica TaxID=390379 RepID=UPI001471E964|nr:BRCA1-associated RING domain protein 1 isoform X1 [Thalassophryne amazonica]